MLTRTLFPLLACGLLSFTAFAQVDESLAHTLSVADVEVLPLPVPPPPGGSLALAVAGQRFRGTLALEPVNWRSAAFTLRVQDVTGAIRDVPAPPARTYQGSVVGAPGSRVAASVVPGGWKIAVWLSDGGSFFVQPVPATRGDERAGTTLHALYAGHEVIRSAGGCDLDRLPEPTLDVSRERLSANSPPGRAAANSNCIQVAEIALDADYEYFQRFGSVAAVTANLDAILNATNAIYARDVLLRHELTDVIVRTAEPDPYDQSDSGALLDQFRTHWNTQQSHLTNDVVHLFTGRDLDGNIIGLAWVGVVCTSSRYGLSQFLTNHSSEISVLAHELGHNWASPHCLDPTPCNLMCGGCHEFGKVTIDVILDHAASRACLQPGTPHPTPLPPLARPDRVVTVNARRVDVLANDHDGNCEDVYLHAFDARSRAGGTVTRSVGTGPGGRDEVLYTPPVGFVGTDTFQVTIADASNLTSSSEVEIEVLDGVPDLVLHYAFDEAQGQDCLDDSGQGRNGTYQHSPTLARAGVAPTSGNAVFFDGTDDRVRLVNDPGLDALRQNVSVAAWIRPNRLTGVQRIFGSRYAWLFGLSGSDLVFTVDGVQDYVVPVGLSNQTWVHVAASFDVDHDVTFWVDGARLGTVSGSRSAGAPATRWFVAANPSVFEHYQGRMDDLQVYDAVFTDADVLQLFQNPGRSLCTASFGNYGEGVAGQIGVPSLTLDRRPRTGSTVNVRVGNGFGLPAAGSLVFGFQPLELPLLGGTLLVDPFFALTLFLPREGLDVPIALPAEPALWCERFYFQAMHVDLVPGTFAISRGLFVRVGP